MRVGHIAENIARACYRKLPRSVGEPMRLAYSSVTEARKINREVKISAADVYELSKLHRGEKIFVDCGFNSGLVTKGMLKHLPDFKAYGFEVNQHAFGAAAQRLMEENPRVLDLAFAAVSDHDGQETFYEMGSQTYSCPLQGTTIIEGLDPKQARGQPTTVASVDFSSWLKDVYARHSNGAAPFIAVKMDIEGAEYDVLERMREQGALDLIDYLAVEFHARRFPRDQRAGIQAREDTLRNDLDQTNGLYVHEWI